MCQILKSITIILFLKKKLMHIDLAYHFIPMKFSIHYIFSKRHIYLSTKMDKIKYKIDTSRAAELDIPKPGIFPPMRRLNPFSISNF